ncbi:hypothetical protein GCM10010195_50950 [Kitasatospora griseola]|nr:hypothetical protein GCM10010195_50950 [Kitasatospora griseola]
MAERERPAWDASSLLLQFAIRLDRAGEYTDLRIHSIWALMLTRRGPAGADPRSINPNRAPTYDTSTHPAPTGVGAGSGVSGVQARTVRPRVASP